MKFYVIHANNLSVALEEKAKLQKKYPDAEIEVGHFGPVIGSHLGEKRLGLPSQRNNKSELFIPMQLFDFYKNTYVT